MDRAERKAKPMDDNHAAKTPAAGASSPAPDRSGLVYTHNAEEGLNAAELINSALGKRVIGSVAPRHIEVAPPSGPSTSGGKKARQPITLVQTSQPAPAVMIGFLDAAHKTAGIREYELVVRQFEARFRFAFETTPDEYQALTKDLAGMLVTLGYKLVPDEPRDDGRSSLPPSPKDERKPLAIAFAVVGLALLGLLLTRC
jgi:hypothetical protein